MIRFVDLTPFYWVTPDGPPCCAFMNTVCDMFVTNSLGTHTFDSMEEVQELGDRYVSLVPEGFFKPELRA